MSTVPIPSNNGYQGISVRNLFRLRQPDAVTPIPPADPPTPKLTLKGITTYLDRKLALLNAALPSAKPGEAGRDESYVLAEGQGDGNIKVLQINEAARSVTVDDFGTITNITFDRNGAEPPTPGGVKAGVPGAPGVPGVLPPPAAAGSRSGLRAIPFMPK
jgi:hypothetical protein